MKLELIDYMQVGVPTREALSEINNNINELRDKLEADTQDKLELMTPVSMLEGDLSFKVERRKVEITKIDENCQVRTMGYVELSWPWLRNAGYKTKLEWAINTYNIDDTYELRVVGEFIDVAYRAIEGGLVNFTKSYEETYEQIDKLNVTRRALDNDLKQLKEFARAENHTKLISYLKNGINLSSMLPDGRVNLQLYRTKTKDFYGTSFKVIKENAKSLVLEVKMRERVFNYDTNEYGEYKLGKPFEVKALKDEFLPDLEVELKRMADAKKEKEENEK